jgi:hypothetical protein
MISNLILVATIEILNKQQKDTKLSNLVFSFYFDDEGYWGTFELVRFLDENLVLKPNQKFEKTVAFDSLTFGSFIDARPVPLAIIKAKMKVSKKLTLKASMTDFWSKTDPGLSNF